MKELKKNNKHYTQLYADFIRKFRNSSLYSKLFFNNIINRFYPLFSKKARLLWLNIEFTSLCNLRCRMCSLDKNLSGGFMENEILQKILSEIVSSSLLRIKNLALWYGGETLLHPQLRKMLEIIASFKRKNIFFPYVTILTNGVLMKGEKLEAILQSGAADMVLFSVDGGTKESFEYLRNGATWEMLLDNINNLIAEIKSRKLPLKTGLVCIIENENIVSQEFKNLRDKVDIYLPRKFHSWDGSRPLGIPQKKELEKKGICYSITRQMAVHWNGNVSPCCMDLNQRGIIGNVKENSLYEIYHSLARGKIIEKMLKMNRGRIDSCRYCSS